MGRRALEAFGDTAKKVGDVFNKRAEYRADADGRMHELVMAADDRQAAINAIDAKSGNFFQYGWRPFIGWGCGLAVIGNGFLPILNALTPMELPMPDMAVLMPLITGMLGMGGLRSYDKLKKTQSDSLLSPRQRRKLMKAEAKLERMRND